MDFYVRKMTSTPENPAKPGFTARLFYFPSSPESASYSDKDARTDESGNQISEPARENDAEHRQNRVCDNRTDDSKKDVHENTHIALHELFGEPPGNATNDDCGDPTYSSRFHDFLLGCCSIIFGDSNI